MAATFRYMKEQYHIVMRRAGGIMTALAPKPFQALEIRVRGRVQGVGFRPTLWRMARELGLAGEVSNDAEGVLLRVGGDRLRIAAFLNGIKRELPPLARIDAIETRDYTGALFSEFRIAESAAGGAKTEIAPDTVICKACAAELRDRTDRHYRYPFLITERALISSTTTSCPEARPHCTLGAWRVGDENAQCVWDGFRRLTILVKLLLCEASQGPFVPLNPSLRINSWPLAIQSTMTAAPITSAGASRP